MSLDLGVMFSVGLTTLLVATGLVLWTRAYVRARRGGAKDPAADATGDLIYAFGVLIAVLLLGQLLLLLMFAFVRFD